jgi:hypothetical protein
MIWDLRGMILTGETRSTRRNILPDATVHHKIPRDVACDGI